MKREDIEKAATGYAKEIWKSVIGYERLYKVSNLGKVKSMNYKHTGLSKILTPIKTHNGYLQVKLYRYGKMSREYVHRIVASAFIPNFETKPQVNHKNENKSDNRVENLEWVTSKENLNYGTRVKRAAKSKSKSMLQFSIDGKLLNTWESARLAARTLGYNQGNISQCCVGKFKTMYGYKWKYDLLPNMEE